MPLFSHLVYQIPIKNAHQTKAKLKLKLPQELQHTIAYKKVKLLTFAKFTLMMLLLSTALNAKQVIL